MIDGDSVCCGLRGKTSLNNLFDNIGLLDEGEGISRDDGEWTIGILLVSILLSDFSLPTTTGLTLTGSGDIVYTGSIFFISLSNRLYGTFLCISVSV